MAGKVTQEIRHLRAPQGIGFAPESNRLAVANDRDGSCRLYDGASLQQIATVELNDDADNVRYDAASGRFWVGYGDGGLAEIDPESGKQTANLKLDAHPESFQLENKGKRIFVNVPNAGHVAVIVREKGECGAMRFCGSRNGRSTGPIVSLVLSRRKSETRVTST